MPATDERRTATQAQAENVPAPPQGAPPETLFEECLDDVALPPGGGRYRAPAIPTPCDPQYLTRQGRDLRLDLLRGYFVFAMIVDHVRGQSPLYLITGGNRFYTSAAEGFILTSGLVTGLVYRKLIEREGLSSGLMKVLMRAATLYLLTVGLTLALLPLSEILFLPWAQGVSLADPLGLVISVLTLHRTYYLVDVLVLYTVLFLVAPMAFVLLDRGKPWPILIGTIVLWGVYQFYPEYTSLPWPIAGNYLFNFSAWQVLFFLGLLLGYYQHRMPGLSRRAARIALVVMVIATASLIAAYFIIDPPTATMPSGIAVGSPVYHEIRLWLQENFFAKVDLRPGRLLASGITFSFLFLVCSLFWPWVQRIIGWLFLPLGQHALYAYTAHIVVVVVVAIALKPFNIVYPGPQWLNMIIQIASVLVIWLLVRWQVLAPTPHTRHLWYASPLALAVVLVIGFTVFPPPLPPALAGPSPDAVAAAQASVPRRFGTPIPIAAPAQPGAAPQATPTPTIPPSVAERRPQAPPESEARLQQYRAGLSGKLLERWFYSAELDAVMPYVIYLPPDYDVADRRYPVLYMLHGRGGHRDEWLAYGLIDVADREIRAGRIRPMIIVLPQGDKWYWANDEGDVVRWGEYIVRDVVREIDVSFRTIRSSSARAIGGLSMGGWGALYHAFRRPDVFGVVGAHSPSLRLPGDQSTIEFLGSGEEYAGKDPIELARRLTGIENLRIWLDTAQKDPWLYGAFLLHDILTLRGIDHIWQLYEGVHEWSYWREHAIDYVRFYADVLAQQ